MLNINKQKPLASVIVGHFNARSTNWWSQDITNSQGSIIDTLTSTSGYHQLINSPSHMTNANYKFFQGVLQGSILGLLLFSLFLCDLFLFVEEANIMNYADDNTPYVCS